MMQMNRALSSGFRLAAGHLTRCKLKCTGSHLLSSIGRMGIASSPSCSSPADATHGQTGVKKIGVVGLGLMGHGVAQVAAERGYEVVATEINDESVERGMGMIKGSMDQAVRRAGKKGGDEAQSAARASADDALSRLSTSTSMDALAECDVIIEAATENLEAKRGIFKQLSEIAAPDAILASNTSSLLLSDISASVKDPSRLVGLHFFNPVQMMKLVEVVRGADTTDAVMDRATALARDGLGKTAITCGDTPGFVVNRLLVPYLAQAVAMRERDVASRDDIDAGMKLGAGHPMGPLMLADYVGLDLCLSILEGWTEKFPDEPAFHVPGLLRDMVGQGRMGRKSGRGFYTWQGNKVVPDEEA